MLIAGVDGCKAGWIAVIHNLDVPDQFSCLVYDDFAEIVTQADLIAVDMPIGLPDRIIGNGREAEVAIRPHLGQRRSSIFAIPARGAVYAVLPQPRGMAALLAGHAIATATAKELSDPPKGLSFQAFNLFPKIREIDQLLCANAHLRPRVHEAHPEAAFWRMNGNTPLATAKKLQGKVNPAGIAERRALLLAAGLPERIVTRSAPRGAGLDDYIDALACLVVAERLARGIALSFPDPAAQDSHGLTIAIRV